MDGDEVIFEQSVKDNEDNVLFSDKRYNFIVDQTSNQGSFSSGQMQWSLKTMSSQSQWVSLKEAVVEFPIKVYAKVTQAAAGGGTATHSTVCGLETIILKNGFHQWINSAQLIVNGQTIQSLQQYENVAASYRILSSWSKDTLSKWGSTTCFALDDCTADGTGLTATIDNVGLNNATAATVMTAIRGYDAVNNQSILANKGVIERCKLNNTQAVTTNVAGAILGTAGIINSGIANCDVTADGTSTVTPVNTIVYSQCAMATVRLRDLFDINEFPLVKNIDGYLYVNFNSFQTTLTNTKTSTTALTGAVASFTTSPLTGLTCPYMINTGTNGITMDILSGATAVTPTIVTIVGNVDGTTNNMVASTSSAPLLTQARLVTPYYIASPRVDAALTKTQKFNSYEKIVNPIIVAAGQSINYTISVGVPNPRKLVLLPMWQNLGLTTPNTATLLSSPEQSPWDTVPATSSPYAYLNQLQVYLANKPLFQYPINYDFEMWNSEISSLGANGNCVDELTSGLLTQQLWQQNHRYYTIDLERRLESEDGAPKSIQVSFVNPSATYGMKVIAMIFYEKRWNIVTDLCKLSSYA